MFLLFFSISEQKALLQVSKKRPLSEEQSDAKPSKAGPAKKQTSKKVKEEGFVAFRFGVVFHQIEGNASEHRKSLSRGTFSLPPMSERRRREKARLPRQEVTPQNEAQLHQESSACAAGVAEMAKACGEKWKSMSDDEKKVTFILIIL